MKLLKEHKLFFIAIMSFLSILLIFLTLNREEPNPVTNAISFVTTPIMSFASSIPIWFNNILSGNELAYENAMLLEEIADIRIQLARLEAVEQSNEELRELVGIRQRYTHLSMVGANIISRTSNNWNTEFIIDKGADDGIAINMPVYAIGIANDGLVGRVISVNASDSLVLPIIDDSSWVSASIRRSGEIGGAEGNIALNPSGLIHFIVPLGTDIIVGDEIITSNHGVTFPPGLMIGTVLEISEIQGSLRAIVTPAANFRDITKVLVITG